MDRITVNLAEATRLTGLSRQSLERHIRAKRLSARKIGSRVLIRVTDLEKFLSQDQPSPARPLRQGSVR